MLKKELAIHQNCYFDAFRPSNKVDLENITKQFGKASC